MLGGGGARGAAHIGLLKVIERERIPVDCIVGTSMGAVVGGLYAAGYGADEIESILTRIDWNQVLRDRPPRDERSMRRKHEDLRLLGGVELGVHDGRIAIPRGIIQGQQLELLLRRLLVSTWRARDFDALPIPFRAVATDIVNGEKVVFDRGDLATAIRASMSVPAAFAPINVDGRLLVDGGVIDNVPIDEARKLGAERMIVSQVGAPLMREEQLDSPLAVSHQMASILMKKAVDQQIATLTARDVLVKPELGDLGSEDFHRSTVAVGAGEAAAETVLPALRHFSVDAAAYSRFQQRHRLMEYDAPVLDFVRVSSDDTRSGDYIEERLAPMVDAPIDIDAVESDIATVYGENRYEKVQWRLEEEDGRAGLVVIPQDKRWGPGFLHFGLRLSDDFDGESNYQLLSQYTRTGLGRDGDAELVLGAALGQVENLFAEYVDPFGNGNRQSLLAGVEYRATNLPLRLLDNSTFAELRYSQWLASLGWAWSPTRNWELSLEASRGEERIGLQVGDPFLFSGYDRGLASVGIGLHHDTLDSSVFPTRGQRLGITHDEFLDSLGGEDDASSTRLRWDAAWSRGKDNLLFGARLTSSTGGENLLATYGFLGGLGNLSGYPEQAIFAPQIALGRIVYYRKLSRDDTLFALPLYAGGSLEWGGYWENRDAVSVDDMIGAGSLFVGMDSFLGPVFLGYGHAESGHSAFYLTFGSLLRGRDPF